MSITKVTVKKLHITSEPAKKVRKGKKRAHVYINELQVDDMASGEYYVKEARIDKTINGDDFTIVNIGDKSGFKTARGWERFDIKPGYVKAAIKCNEYKGLPSYIIERIKNIDEPSDPDVFDVCIDNYDDEMEKFKKFLEDYKNKVEEDFENYEIGRDTIMMVLKSAFVNNKGEEELEVYCSSPCSEDSIYGKKGGVVKRINRLLSLAACMKNIYDLDEIEYHILYTSIFVHLLGCDKGYEIKDCISRETKLGKLYNQELVTITDLQRNMITLALLKKMKPLKEQIDIGMYQRIIHCISAQYPNYRFKAKSIEAIIFSRIILLDNEVTQARHCIDSDESDGEFTPFDWTLKREYFKG